MKTLRLLFGLALVATAFSVQAEDYSEKQHNKLIRECNRNNLKSCVTAAIWTRDYLEAPAHAYPFLKKPAMAAICAAAMFWVICISIRPAV